jgi:hypothetical protein
MSDKTLPFGYIRAYLEYAPKEEKDFEVWCEDKGFDYLGPQSDRRAWCDEFRTYFREASGIASAGGESFLFYDEDVVDEADLVNDGNYAKKEANE